MFKFGHDEKRCGKSVPRRKALVEETQERQVL